MTSKSRPIRTGEQWKRTSDAEVAVYDQSTQALHVLNATALAIWELCDGQTSASEMAAAISDVTELDSQSALSQVQTTLSELEANGLVRYEPER